MVKSYCVTEKEQTECIEPSGYNQAKNGRWMFYCTCIQSNNIKTKFISDEDAEKLGLAVKKKKKSGN